MGETMRVNADLYVKDVPGQLVAALEPLSVLEGNIVGVVHHRDQVMNDRIGVNLTFEIDEGERMEKLLAIWKERDVHVSRIGSVVETYSMDYLLIGDISPSRLETILDEVKDMLGMESLDIRYSSVMESGSRTALIRAKFSSETNLRKAEDMIQDLVREQEILAIRGLGA